jgi:hypothetical protein
MGKWLSRAIEKGKPGRENYQDILENNTDRTDETHSYEGGWEKCFPVKGRPFWRKDGIEVPLPDSDHAMQGNSFYEETH